MPLQFGTHRSSSAFKCFPEPKPIPGRGERSKKAAGASSSPIQRSAVGHTTQQQNRSKFGAVARPGSAASHQSVTTSHIGDSSKPPLYHRDAEGRRLLGSTASSVPSIAVSQMAHGGKKNLGAGTDGKAATGRAGVPVQNPKIPTGPVAAPYRKANGSIVVPQRTVKKPHQSVFEGEVLLTGPSTSIAPSPTVTHLSEFFPTPALNMTIETQEAKQNQWFWRNKTKEQLLQHQLGGGNGLPRPASALSRGSSMPGGGDFTSSFFNNNDSSTLLGGSHQQRPASSGGIPTRGRVGKPMWRVEGDVNYAHHTQPSPLASVLDGGRLRPASAAKMRPESATAMQRSVELHHANHASSRPQSTGPSGRLHQALSYQQQQRQHQQLASASLRHWPQPPSAQGDCSYPASQEYALAPGERPR